jgi:WD40 repeat protein/DNA-binding SARP family transcriptional activator
MQDFDFLRIFTFGGLRIELSGKPLTSFTARKEEALLVYLAASRREHPREVLADLLWDERTQAQALSNLRVVLSGLRHHLSPYLVITRQMVGLNPDLPVWLDATELDQQLASVMIPQSAEPGLPAQESPLVVAQRLEQAVALYRGEFLAGFYVRGSEGFETWTIRERERLHQQVIDALYQLGEIYLDCGAYTAGIAKASRLLQLDSLREDAHRQMMQLLVHIGQRNAAMNQFETCRRLLEQELAVEPSEETLALYRDIQGGKLKSIINVAVNTVAPRSQMVLENITEPPHDAQIPIENPYKGLHAFQESDADNFFGRESFVDTLVARIDSLVQSPADGVRFLALVGPSGSGKTSLVKAGLIPALHRNTQSSSWLVAEIVPGHDPFEKLAAILQPQGSSTSDLAGRLKADQYALQRVVTQTVPSNHRMLLVIDQFEEVFMLVEEEATRKLFLDALQFAVCAPLTPLFVLISLRADFYDRPMGYPGFGNLVWQNNMPVLPLAPEQLEQAIVQPAENVGLSFEAGLMATLIAEVDEQPGMLPLLQYALTELFVHRRERSLTLDAYHKMGGVVGALGGRASELYAALDGRGQRITRQLFLRLVMPGEGVEVTRRRVTRTELASITNDVPILDTVINLYGQYRLLTFDYDAATNSPTVEIAHEALISGWSQLRNWLDESRAAVKLHRRLIASTREWLVAGYNTSFLATGDRLDQFQVLLTNGEVFLNEEERAFISASLAERRAHLAEEDGRRRLEQRLTRRSRAFRNAFYLVLTAAAFSLLVLTGIMLYEQQRAQYYEQAAMHSAMTATSIEGLALTNFAQSESSRLVREGNYILNKGDRSVELATLLYIRALKTAYLPDAETSLLNALSLISTQKILKGQAGWVLGTVFVPHTKYVLTAGRDNTLRLWDTTSGQEIRQYIGHTNDINCVAVSPDGKIALTGSSDNTVRLWDVATGQEIGRYTGHTDDVNSVAISPDGKFALTGSTDDTARLWDIATGQEIRQFAGTGGGIKAVAFMPNGTQILTGHRDGMARLREIATGTQIRTFSGHTGTVLSVAISADSRFVLTGSRDTTARLWDVASGNVLQIFGGHRGWVTSVAFAPNDYVLTASRDSTARLWNADSGKQMYRFVGHTDSVETLAVSPDGSQFLTGSFDKSARLWRTQVAVSPNLLVGHTSRVNSVAFSADGQYAITGSDDQMARLWDVHSHQQIQVFSGHDAGVLSVAFSPDSKYILTGSRDRTARLWEISTGKQVRDFVAQSGWVSSVAFSPDGKSILTVDGTDNAAILWDSATGQRIRVFRGHSRPIFALNFSRDGRLILTGSADNTARLWDTYSGETIKIYAGHSDFVVSVAISADGKRVLTGSDDHTAILWDAASGTIIRAFPTQDFGAYRVAFSPDGRKVATTSGRSMIRPADTIRQIQLWDTETGKELRTVGTLSSEIYSLSFSPDGRYLLTGYGYSSAELWIADYKDLITLACSRIFGDFTPQERINFNITDAAPTCAS